MVEYRAPRVRIIRDNAASAPLGQPGALFRVLRPAQEFQLEGTRVLVEESYDAHLGYYTTPLSRRWKLSGDWQGCFAIID